MYFIQLQHHVNPPILHRRRCRDSVLHIKLRYKCDLARHSVMLHWIMGRLFPNNSAVFLNGMWRGGVLGAARHPLGAACCNSEGQRL